MAWTNPATFLTGQIVTAADLNTYISDNLNFIRTFLSGNMAVFNDTASYNVTATSYAQVGSFSTAITPVATVNTSGVTTTTHVVLLAVVYNNSGTVMTNIQWYNNTTAAVPSVLGPSFYFPANSYVMCIGIDKPASSAQTYILRAYVAAGTATINKIAGWAMEVTR